MLKFNLLAKSQFRLGTKLEAVGLLLGGQSAEAVSKQMNIPTDLLEKWRKLFESAGKSALRYSADPGELPTLRDVVNNAQKAFPTRLLHGCERVASFFCAQFFGKNDMVHVYLAGVPSVTVVDLDRERCSVMEDIYPKDWKFVIADAFEQASKFFGEGTKFDMVTCDPFSSMASTVAWEKFDLFAGIARKYVIFLYTNDMLLELGVDVSGTIDIRDMSRRLSAKLGKDVNVVEVSKRSSHQGGIYWTGIKL